MDMVIHFIGGVLGESKLLPACHTGAQREQLGSRFLQLQACPGSSSLHSSHL